MLQSFVFPISDSRKQRISDSTFLIKHIKHENKSNNQYLKALIFSLTPGSPNGAPGRKAGAAPSAAAPKGRAAPVARPGTVMPRRGLSSHGMVTTTTLEKVDPPPWESMEALKTNS